MSRLESVVSALFVSAVVGFAVSVPLVVVAPRAATVVLGVGALAALVSLPAQAVLTARTLAAPVPDPDDTTVVAPASIQYQRALLDAEMHRSGGLTLDEMDALDGDTGTTPDTTDHDPDITDEHLSGEWTLGDVSGEEDA